VSADTARPVAAAETLAFIALGSNLGDSPRLLCEVADRLAALSTRPLLRSSLWRTAPVDCPPGSADFLNAVVGLCALPGETPASLLTKLRTLEREFGRRPKRVLNEARPLDLDLIAFGAAVATSAGLTLPHPRAAGRRFVLAPLAEIAPDLILPGQRESVRALLASLSPTDCVCVGVRV
jgi:2-amino-4-hydroxy-6-hydroxymethyldihydropteridine diphosphokinase